MTAFNAYRQTTERQWTRIDMLIALYEATGQTLDRGLNLAQQIAADLGYASPQPAPLKGEREMTREQSQLIIARSRATQLLLAILSGIDPEFDEVARNTQRLIIYCLDQVSANSPDNWKAAQQTIETLTEGFRGIRREAQRLQLEGSIPDPFAESLHTLSAG